MPLQIKEKMCAPSCHLGAWAVLDRTVLVKALAWLYLQKPRHSERIIQSLAPGLAHFPGHEDEAAVRHLSYRKDDIQDALASEDDAVRTAAETKRRKRIEMRDGLLFQHISWIAARIRFPKSHLCPPHPRPADKGFDGILIEFSDDGGQLERLVISEDKATTNPRSLVTAQIWPELETIVSGQRDGEVMAAVNALLDRAVGVDHEHILEGVAWSRIRQFRVFLTSPDDNTVDDSFAHIFEGYDERAPDPIEGRMAEVMPLSDVRAFLDALAEDVKAAIGRLADV